MAVPLLLPRPDAETERALYHRGIQIGADGSILQDGSQVYAVFEPTEFRHYTVDYFHGLYGGVPMCQVYSDDYLEPEFLATELIAADRNGFVVLRLRHLQAKFRERRRIRSVRYTARMLQIGILLARKATLFE